MLLVNDGASASDWAQLGGFIGSGLIITLNEDFRRHGAFPLRCRSYLLSPALAMFWQLEKSGLFIDSFVFAATRPLDALPVKSDDTRLFNLFKPLAPLFVPRLGTICPDDIKSLKGWVSVLSSSSIILCCSRLAACLLPSGDQFSPNQYGYINSKSPVSWPLPRSYFVLRR